MQQQELAQMRQRDANLTALAAIGPRKKRKLDSPGGTAAGTEVGTSHIICFYSIALLCQGGVSSVKALYYYILCYILYYYYIYIISIVPFVKLDFSGM